MAKKKISVARTRKKASSPAKRGVKAAAKKGSAVKRAISSVAKAVKKKVLKKESDEVVIARAARDVPKRRIKTVSRVARAPRRQSDVPMAALEKAYSPTQTSLKAPFRASGADRTRDQEFAGGTAGDERWNNEDHYTNRSGDPRIGTHGRTYEPGEARPKKEKR